jgi:hypothetical protein
VLLAASRISSWWASEAGERVIGWTVASRARSGKHLFENGLDGERVFVGRVASSEQAFVEHPF